MDGAKKYSLPQNVFALRVYVLVEAITHIFMNITISLWINPYEHQRFLCEYLKYHT